MAAGTRNPASAAIDAQHADPCRRMQVANGRRCMNLPAGDAALAVASLASWLPMIANQAVPTSWERWDDAEPCFDD